MPIIMIGVVAIVAFGVIRKFTKGPGEVEGGAFQEKLLYEIDRLQVQMQIANERLERLESRYLGPPRGEALPRGEDEGAPT
jgi:hypothetical protein